MKKLAVICLVILAVGGTLFVIKRNSADNLYLEEGLNAPFVKIARNTYSVSDLTAFNIMLYHHPIRGMRDRFPGSRSTSTLFVETQVLYPQASAYRRQVMSGAEWKWKDIYIPGQIYQVNVIDQNMGVSDEDILSYFKRNKDELSAEFRLEEGDTLTLGRARATIVRRLFLINFPPTAEFAAQFSSAPQTEIENAWFQQASGDRAAFFRDLLYRQRFGRDFPRENTRAELVGQGKLISEQDLNIVLSWIPSAQNVPENMVAARMAAWILFADKARASGFLKTRRYRQIREQFERFEVVRHFVNEVLPNRISDEWRPNEEFVRFAIADQSRNPSLNVSRDQLAIFSDSLKNIMHEARIVEFIHGRRTRANVMFLNRDYADLFERTPAQLRREADSLIANNNPDRARRIFRNLSEWFLYSPEGLSAFLEMAKLQADARNYMEAINAYRNYLLFGGNESEWCRVFFMIGYIYAEYLGDSPFAAMNYRWILKNAPDCSLASDAEFMYLNLGEPMISIEELRQMSIRQGRE